MCDVFISVGGDGSTEGEWSGVSGCEVKVLVAERVVDELMGGELLVTDDPVTRWTSMRHSAMTDVNI